MLSDLNIKPQSILEYWRKCVKDTSCAEPKLIRESRAFEEKMLSFRYSQNEDIKETEVLSEGTETDIIPDSVEPLCIENFDISNYCRVPYNEVANLKRLIVGSYEKDEMIKVLIAPFRIKKAKKNIKSKDPITYHYYYPFWYPAEVLKEGLVAPKYSHPFISRKLLSPYENKYTPFIIGEASEYDQQCAKFSNSFNNFNDYIKSVKNFFFKITGKQIDDYFVEELELQNTATIVLDDGFSASHHIIRLYNSLVNSDNIPPLLNSLIEGTNNKSQVNPNAFEENKGLLLGSMNNFEDALNGADSSDSQKVALSIWFKDINEKILAVTGPPGTGKTFLLKNLVANAIVQSAINGDKPDPHIFIAASLSNQAINNVIHYLEECGKYRWLPDASAICDTFNLPTTLGVGVFMTSKSAEEKSQKYLFIQNYSQGSYRFYESREYLTEAEKIFKERCFKKYRIPEGETISEFLRKELLELISVEKTIGDNKLPAFRVEVFTLALHYWEARWLEEAHNHNKSEITSLQEFERIWKWRAMLTPCFAGTFHTLPDVFLYKEKREEGILYHYLTEVADTLIVDEAGQVAPEIGAPIFSFAKRAIVLGDVQQIEPIWDITRKVDKGNLEICKIKNDEQTIDALNKSGHLCSSGNLMKLAQNATWIQSEIPGIPLKEHFRCYDEIIQFSDKLCYGYIIPKVGNSKFDATLPECQDPFPPFQIIPVIGISQCQNVHSPCNEMECFAIRKWIEDNYEKINNKFGNIQDAIAILTPYKSQVTLIKKLLKGEDGEHNSKKMAGLVNILSSIDNENKKHEIVVGTVHSMQGAQRPIILFSSVVSQEDGLDFVDSHMVNVAVSRAQKSFIAFSNPGIFQKQGDYPLKKLNSYYQELTKQHPKYILDNSYITSNPEDIQWQKRIFISYRHTESNVADNVINCLVSLGYSKQTIFRDKQSISGGDNFPKEIMKAINECRYFILLFSEESISRCNKKNDWVAKEILTALDKDCRIIPVNIGNCTPDWNWIEDEGKRNIMESKSWISYDYNSEYMTFQNELEKAIKMKQFKTQ